MNRKKISTLFGTLLCLCACFLLICGADAEASEPVLALYSDPELTAEWTKTNGVYQIPVQADIYARINAENASSAILRMGDSEDHVYDLTEHDEWESGEWGENHGQVVMNVWYDNSCAVNEVQSYTMELELDGETAASVDVRVTSEGQISVTGWLNHFYYMTHENGNVTLSGRNRSGLAGWTRVTQQNGFRIGAGKKLYIEGVPPVEHSQWIYVALGRSDGRGSILWWDEETDTRGIFDEGDLRIENGTGHYSTYGIEPGTDCVLWISTGGVGYDQSHLVFPVTIESDLTLSLSPYQEGAVSTSNGVITTPLNQWVNFEAYAPGADFVLVYNTTGPAADIVPDGEGDSAATRYGQYTPDGDGYAYFGYTPNETMMEIPDNTSTLTRYVFAMARYTDDEGSRWVRSSEYRVDIQVSSTINGTFSYSHEEGTVARDEVFSRTITFNPASGDPGIDQIGMRIEDSEGKWISDSHWVKAAGNVATVSLPPLELEPGTYDVTLYAIRYGAPRKDEPNAFTLKVTKAENQGDSHILIGMKHADTYTYTALEPAPIFVYYDKPANIGDVILQVQMLGPDGDVWMEREVPGCYYWTDWDCDGENRCTLRVTVMTWEGDEIESRDFPISVSAEHKITIARPADLPASVTLGTPVSFTVSKPEHADRYEISVTYYHDGETVWLRSLNNLTDASRTVTISAEELPPEGAALDVSVYAAGWNAEAESDTWTVSVVPANPEITLSAAEGLDANGCVPINQDVRFVVNDPESRGFATICFFNGLCEEGYEDAGYISTFDKRISFPDAGTYGVFAKVTFDEWNYEWDELDYDPRVWYPTNAVTVKAEALGQVGEFSASLDTNGPIRRGDMIPVVYTAAAHADHYSLNIFEVVDGETEWLTRTAELVTSQIANPSDGEVAGTAALHTAMLEAGKTYEIYPGATGIGYTWREMAPFTITIEEPADSGIFFRVSAGENNTIATGEHILVSAYAPDAVGIDLLFDRTRNEEWDSFYDGDSFSDQLNPYWNPGTYRMVARAWYPEYDLNGDPVWVTDEDGNFMTDEEGNNIQQNCFVDSDAVDLTVTSSGTVSIGLPANPVLPSCLVPGADLQFTVPFISGGEWMNVDLQVQYEDGQRWGDSLYHWESNGSDITRTVSWTDLQTAGVQPGQAVVLIANGGKAGYEVRGWEKIIPVVAESTPDGLSLVFEKNGPDENGQVFLNQRMTISLTPPQGRTFQQIRFYHGVGYWNGGQDEVSPMTHPEWFREDNSFVAEWEFDQYEHVGLQSFFAYYQLDGDDDWSMTEPVTVSVNALGTVGRFDFVSSQAREITVSRGTPVVFEFTVAEAGENGTADNYWIGVFPAEGGDCPDPAWSTNATTVIMYTEEMPAGTYDIRGRAGKAGWIWAESDSFVRVTVTEPEEETVSLHAQWTELVTMEPTRWFAYAPGAVNIVVEGYMNDAAGNRNTFFENSNEDWDDPAFISGENGFGGHEGTAYIEATATFADGSVKKAGPLQISVSAPYGELAPLKVYSAPYYGDHANFDVVLDNSTEQYELDIYMHYEGTGGSNYTAHHDTGEGGGGIGTFDYDPADEAHIRVAVYQGAYGYNDRYDEVWLRPLDEDMILNLPASLTSIEEEAFEGSDHFAGVIIPETVTSIGSRAFAGCGRLWAVVVPDLVSEFGQEVFQTGNITLYGFEGSGAESYARSTGTDFVYIR